MTALGQRKKKKGPRSVTAPREEPLRPTRWRIPFAMMIRMFFIGSVAVIACIWAIWRHYSTTRPSMLQSVPRSSSSSAHPGEIEIEATP